MATGYPQAVKTTGLDLPRAFVDVESKKSFVNLSRPLGLEFEMLCPVTENKSRHEFQVALARILSANGVPAIARSYSTTPLPRGIIAAVEFDDSLIPPQTLNDINWANLEVKTTKLAGLAEYDRYVPRLLNICAFINCGINESCGLHVNLGLDSELANPHFLRSFMNVAWRFEPVLFGLVHPTRLTCGYACPMPDQRRLWNRNITQEVKRRLLGLWSKYYGINLRHAFVMSQPGQQRIESRMHEGTLDPVAVRHWVILLNRLIDHAATHRCKFPKCQTPNDRNGLEKLFITCGLKSNSRLYAEVSPELVATRRYLLRRWRRLSALKQ